MESVIEEIERLLSKKYASETNILINSFRVGRIVSAACKSTGEKAVLEIIKALSEKGYDIDEEYLFKAKRVYETYREEGKLFALKKRLEQRMGLKRIGKYFNFSFIGNRCTKSPLGDSIESRLYMEKELSKIEDAYINAGRLSKKLKFMPTDVRAHAEGILKVIGRHPNGHDGNGSGTAVCAAEGNGTDELTEKKDIDALAIPAASAPLQTMESRTVLDGDFVFGHIGDLQICEAVTTAGRIVLDAETGVNERLLDQHKCFTYAVNKMIERKCRVCLVSGDLMETSRPTPNEVKYALYGFNRLAMHMPVIAMVGNHELPKEVRDAHALEFLRGRPNIFVIDQPTVLYKDCAKIFALPFPSKAIIGENVDLSIEDLNHAVSDKLRLILESFRGELDPVVPNILMLHISIKDAEGVSDIMTKYDPVLNMYDLRGFDYVAVNHIHIFQQIGGQMPADMLVSVKEPINAWYSGSIDRCDFNEEDDPKGFIVCTMKGKKPEVEFIETPARVFKTLSPEFFRQENWKELVDPRTIYRIKGEVTKEEYEQLKSFIKDFPIPLQNKLTKKRGITVGNEKMTEELKEDEALVMHLSDKGYPKDFVSMCLKAHHDIESGRN